MKHNSDRKAFEACIVEIVQCLACLCDTRMEIFTDPDEILTLVEADGSCILGYEVKPDAKYFQFDFEFIQTEAAYLKHKKYDHHDARIGLRIHLPEPITTILRKHFCSELLDNVDYALTGHSDIVFELVINGMLYCNLEHDFENFTVDSMTDTMLRHAYADIVNELHPLMPWLRFARFLSQQHYNYEQIENIQKRLPSILNNALQNNSIADAHVFTLCELSGSFEPAMRLFKKRYGDLFLEEME
jgi:hypothetical protein